MKASLTSLFRTKRTVQNAVEEVPDIRNKLAILEKDWRKASSAVESGDLDKAIIAKNNLSKMLQFVEAFNDM